MGFDETQCGHVALVVTEAASNLARHAQDGELLLQAGGDTLEVLALDRGPGMADVARCLQDGFSTTGTAGEGLGAILRLSERVDVDSSPGIGTALLARLRRQPADRQEAVETAVGALSLPRPGELACGDAWAVELRPGRAVFLVADGLGHGPDAARAAEEALPVFHEVAWNGPVQVVRSLHDALRSTRGAAVAVAEVDAEAEVLRFCGVGNIAGTVVSAGVTRSVISHNGTAGHEAYRFQEFAYPFLHDALLVLHSDGLGSRWSPERYPGLALRDPSLIAGVLYRDFKRSSDDVTVLVARPAAV